MNPASRSGNYEYNKLPLSLEELYKGCRLRFKNSRTVFDSRGRTKLVEEILKIDVEPGWKKDTTLRLWSKTKACPRQANQAKKETSELILISSFLHSSPHYKSVN
ncbi:hypothetical protein K1719_002647 [Acacia pycnantha]|nr:hypothetical protein K1719_002647 [Acacia pycnantha]